VTGPVAEALVDLRLQSPRVTWRLMKHKWPESRRPGLRSIWPVFSGPGDRTLHCSPPGPFRARSMPRVRPPDSVSGVAAPE
jgi:hypothetical protein